MFDITAFNGMSSNIIENNVNKTQEDLFLKILTTQMSQQDPLSPQDNNEWINQFTQFSILNNLVNANSKLKSLEFSSAFNLIGKEVVYSDEENNEQKGLVESISQKDGGIFLNIDSKEIPLEKLLSVNMIGE